MGGTELGINGVLIVAKAQNDRDMNVEIFPSIQNVIQLVVLLGDFPLFVPGEAKSQVFLVMSINSLIHGLLAWPYIPNR